MKKLTTSWKWEIVALITSFIFLLAMIGLLVAYNDLQIFHWHGITLNTYVSVLSTASKATLIFAVAEAIGQWKWILFAYQSRPLLDLEKIDSASRGPLGSIKLIWSKRISLLRFGAVIIILAIALDPFAQQLVQFRQRQKVVPGLSTIPRAQRYSKGFQRPFSFTTPSAVSGADLQMQMGILSGITQSFDSVVKETNFDCPTGYCEWNEFESLAVCSQCNDLPNDFVEYSENTDIIANLAMERGLAVADIGTTLQLSNGLIINNPNIEYLPPYSKPNSTLAEYVYMTTYGTGNTSETVSFQDIDTLIWSMTFLRLEGDGVWPDIPIKASECALYYCVKEYKSKVQNGTLFENEKVITSTRVPNSWVFLGSIEHAVLNRYIPWNDTELTNSLDYNNRTSTYDWSDLMVGDYNITRTAVHGINGYFHDSFAMNVSLGDTSEKVNGWYLMSGSLQWSPPVAEYLYNSTNLNDTFTTLARSMSNVIRDDTVFEGVSFVMVSCYTIKWGWIALHGTLIIAGAVFLFITVRMTSIAKIPAWKSNSLALLSFHDQIGGVLQDVSKEEMDRKAGQSFVQLFGEKEGT